MVTASPQARIDGTSGLIRGSMHWTRRPRLSRVSMITLEKNWESCSSYLRYLMWMPLRLRTESIPSEDAVLLIDLGEKASLEQLVARAVLAGRLSKRFRQRFVFHGLRDHHDPVVVPEHEISRVDFHATALDGDVDVGDESAAPRVERHDPARERRKAHRDDALHVANDCVDDGARRAAHARRGRQELSPWGDRPRMIGAVHGHVSGTQRIDGPDLVDVRIRLDRLEGLHPEERPRPADHDEVRMQWPDVVTHRLLAESESIERVGYDRRVELLADPGELFLFGFPVHA